MLGQQQSEQINFFVGTKDHPSNSEKSEAKEDSEDHPLDNALDNIRISK